MSFSHICLKRPSQTYFTFICPPPCVMLLPNAQKECSLSNKLMLASRDFMRLRNINRTRNHRDSGFEIQYSSIFTASENPSASWRYSLLQLTLSRSSSVQPTCAGASANNLLPFACMTSSVHLPFSIRSHATLRSGCVTCRPAWHESYHTDTFDVVCR